MTRLSVICVLALATIGATPAEPAAARPTVAVLPTAPGSPGAPPHSLAKVGPSVPIPECAPPPPPPPTNPNPPTNVQASSPSNDNVTVITWTPPADTTGIVQYMISTSAIQGPFGIFVPAPATSAHWANLPPVSQTFVVWSVYQPFTPSIGNGSALPFTPNATAAAGAPGAPTPSVAQSGVGAVKVSWTASSGSPTRYEIWSQGNLVTTVAAPATFVVLGGGGPNPLYGSGTFHVDAVNSQGTSLDAATNFASPVAGGTFHSLVPNRILDTRDGTGGVPATPLGTGSTLTVQVAGRAGVPQTGISAVVLNATVTNTTGSSFLTIWPRECPMPVVSNLNWTPGVTVPNLVVVALGDSGQLNIYNLFGNTDVVFDVAGWIGDNTNSTGNEGLFNPLTPARLLDTRNGQGPIGQMQTINLQVTGAGGVPASGVSAVVLNVTVTNPTVPSYLTVSPAGAPRPLASNLNFVHGQTVPNRVVVRVGDGGQVSLFNFLGSTDVVVDVNGWFTDATNPNGGAAMVAIKPVRAFDTRPGFTGPPPAKTPLGPGGTAIIGALDVTATVANVTVTNPTASGYLTLYPNNVSRPLASDLNFVPGLTVPNLTVVKSAPDNTGFGGPGSFAIYNFQGYTDVVVDFYAGFGPPVVPLNS